MSQPKVYEFAKEIGVETLALMDKIREWNLPIKSHMALLDESLIVEIKKRYALEAGVIKESKVKTVKKKSNKKKTAGKSVRKVVTAASKAEEKTTKKKSTKKISPKVKTVIRRKAGEKEESASILESLSLNQYSSVLPETSLEVEAEISHAHVDDQSLFFNENIQQETLKENPKMESPLGPSRSDHLSTEGKTRRNIIGKMDLKRVVHPSRADASSTAGGVSSSGYNSSSSTGFLGNQTDPSRPPRPGGGGTGRTLRTGFVAQVPFFDENIEVDKNDLFKEKEDKLKKKIGAGKDPAASTVFSASEFRKREIVFQPKKKKIPGKGEVKKTEITTPKASKRVIRIQNNIKVGELANQINLKAPQLIKKLMAEGIMATVNTDLDFDTVALLLPEFGYEAQNVVLSPESLLELAVFGDLNAEPVTRTPVVTVMGHVDHGKTTLLDSIRQADVASGEAGGITQHIGAYQVTLEDGSHVTFIDTPGHAAFTAMRARGANVTDIAIIVVAADDGVMPQTAEAINHAKVAQVPIIVAVNKMDKPGANPDRIKQQLTEFQLVPEEWGGSTIFCPVSALKGQGIKELLEQIRLVAEVQELRANPLRSGTGIVIESRMEKGRGCVATLLVKDGTIRVGQDVVAGMVAGRIRAMNNDRGEKVNEALPGTPVEVIGLPEVPLAGDRFDITQDEESARSIASLRKLQAAHAANSLEKNLTLEHIFSKVKMGSMKELSVVLKGDVAGSLEAIKGMLEKVGTEEVKVKLVHSAIGGISESDVLLASTAHGLVIGFNVRPDSSAQRISKEKNIEIKCYTIIYELIDDIKKSLSGLLQPKIVEKSLGRAQVRDTFSVPKSGMVAGCSVVDGKISRNNQLRLVRDGRIIYQGKISSLRRFKDDVKEVLSGFECGIGIENFNDIKVGDVIETFEMESVNREL